MANNPFSGVHTLAYYGTSFSAGVTVPVELPALNDQVFALSGTTGLIASRDLKIIAAYMGGGTAARL